MSAPVPIRMFRTLLAISVAMWMAGAGCLWGCSNSVMAAESPTSTQTQTVISGPSCHSPGHDCCAKKSSTKSAGIDTQHALSSIVSVIPEGMMKDCPLAVNASAVGTTKSTVNSPDLTRATVTELPNVENRIEPRDWGRTQVQFLNRGPTYLRCCVFLI
jgi:hypothetical protein